ncbi:dihydrolipoyl dehydrogenase [Buchnera aphidicola]|uniref:dihydrolipoyl dehydrogenase n=1 Tax=Buchnera aphidicola TaxID=9 RepID=UPI002093BE86|nr:dihydrolipoyl dehydrogenase [Buchnera aphidicola]USS94273.1 dihydrolipoyl dehydrogenase [Buchnera aphidicola (Sipha maydis)]WII23823.1 dihydrolipoyl dehydrogenase [Buchnera aphidicola (Sipha maydis)]
MNKKVINTNLAIIGGGPAGYSAAFRASDLGIKTILIEKKPVLGGVCLNVGCIPSKALLHFSKFLKEYDEFCDLEIFSHKLSFNLKKLNLWKKNIIRKMNHGLKILADKRQLKVIHGEASFINKKEIFIKHKDSNINVQCKNIIIASGSTPIKLSSIDNENKNIWNSTDALKIPFIPRKMLIIGGGIIGLEMATVYSSLGAKIDIIENSDRILPSCDLDVSSFFINSINKKFNLLLDTYIEKIESLDSKFFVKTKKNGIYYENKYDVILVSIGRFPNTNLNLTNVNIDLDKRGFIITDQQCRTNIKNIFAIGDVSGNPMLAHKGIYEGHIAAEVISGKNHFFDTNIIPNICYTDPEIAWVGMGEEEAIKNDIEYEKSIFPWSVSGRACVSNSSYGMTKLIFDKNTKKIIGGSIVGRNAGELLGEITLGIEMGCDVSDISLTIHAHPTLYESINSAAKISEGTITDLLNLK